jgi:protein TonB
MTSYYFQRCVSHDASRACYGLVLGVLLTVLVASLVLVTPAFCGEQDVQQPEVVGELGGESIYRYMVGGQVTEPKKLSTVSPIYPEAARRARIVGAVIIRTVISTSGEVVDHEVLRGLPLGLSEAAVNAIRQWTFEPAILNGRPVPVSYVLTVRFNLDEGNRRTGELVIDGMISKDRPLPTLVIHQVSEKLPEGCMIAQMRLTAYDIRVVGIAVEGHLVDEFLSGLEQIDSLTGISIGDRSAAVDESKYVRFTVSAKIVSAKR